MKHQKTWNNISSWVACLMFMAALFQQYIPYSFQRLFNEYVKKIQSYFSPYIQIKFEEYFCNELSEPERSTAYLAIQQYLEANSMSKAKRLKANSLKNSQNNLVLSMDDYEEITDEYQGITVWWDSRKSVPKSRHEEQQRYYILTFHARYRDLITESYMKHVLTEGKAKSVKNRKRKLYTNKKHKSWSSSEKSRWIHVVFEHPATFENLALDPELKKDIMNDLINFSKAKDYYAKVGKAWKRGYLLYGPPGTGKSTMIAAMANLLQYDVYDLELTSVNDNTELKKLLIETSGKSIIVIEDIDCSLDLTGQRKKKGTDPVEKRAAKVRDDASRVTLSGLLNFIDGLWSACAGERIIVFTTNYKENLDPALIRRGRMDKHISLSYCSFEAFKVLAKNYLDIESHNLFGSIQELLAETDITPADVAENLMSKSAENDGETGLKCLISALENAKLASAKLKMEVHQG